MILLTALGAHLWQSTLFAVAIGAVTLALRSNRASIRHALWLAASIKFLVPFAALMMLGAAVGPRGPILVTESETVVVFANAGPAAPLAPGAVPRVASEGWQVSAALMGSIWLCGALFVFGMWTVRWRQIASIVKQGQLVDTSPEVDALRRLERAAGVSRPIRLVETTAMLEPGVFGFRRPVLLWPRAIAERLDAEQLETILAHEVSHVRRRDNLAAAVHMVVEAVCWFHPLAWWIGARLVDERERACDEAVVRLGSDPGVYAQTILVACRTFLESPLACVAGVTGSDLRKRIERIVAERPLEALSRTKRLLVVALPVAAVVVPIVVGVRDAPRLRAESLFWEIRAAVPQGGGAAPRFEVASIKPSGPGISKVGIQAQPNGRFSAENVTLRQLIRFAYQMQDSQLSGGPKWLDEDHFDIIAKAEGDGLGDPFRAEQAGQPTRAQLMLRALLAERFSLQVHTDWNEQSIYALIPARRDAAVRVKRSEADCGTPSPQCGIRVLPGTMRAGGVTMAQLANSLTPFAGRLVVDRTELTGTYDFTLSWTPDQVMPGINQKAAAMNLPAIDPNGASIFTAVQEQLGLKLDSQKGRVETLVIDRAEHPKEN